MSQYPPQPPNQPPPPWQGYPPQQPSQYPPQNNTGWQQPSGPQWPQQQPVAYSPPAQSFQPTDPARKKTLRIGMWVGIGLVVALILLGIVNAAISGAANASQVVKVGQTITLHGVSATLTGVGTLECGGNTCQPEQIAAHIKLVNNSGSEQSYSFLNFHAKSGSGTITNAVFTIQSLYQSGTLLGTGNLVPGGTVEGDVVFQALSYDDKAEVTWQPTASDSDSANGWMLGL